MTLLYAAPTLSYTALYNYRSGKMCLARSELFLAFVSQETRWLEIGTLFYFALLFTVPSFDFHPQQCKKKT